MHSCETGLASLINNWYNEIDKDNIIGAINIDLRKAFNLVNLDILIFNFKNMVVAILLYLGLNLISVYVHNMSPFQIMILILNPLIMEFHRGQF